MIDIDDAKKAAALIEQVRSKRTWVYRDDDKHGWAGVRLSDWVERFVLLSRTSRYSKLGVQFTEALSSRRATSGHGFDPRLIDELYEAACKKHTVGWLHGEKEENPDGIPQWPGGYYTGTLCDVHLLVGTDSVRIGRWIGACANVVDESKRHVGVLVRFLGEGPRTGAGPNWIDHVIDLDDLTSDGSKMFQALEAAGYQMSGDRKARAALRRLVIDSESDVGLDKNLVRYSRPGWHGDKFVLPTGATANGEKAFVTGGVAAAPGGTHEEWCEHIRDEIWQGETPQFATGMLAGLSGILSSRLACDHPVVYFTGPTSTGKTTSQIIGAGLVANPNDGRGTLFGVGNPIDIPRGLGTTLHIDDPTKRASLASAKKIESLIYDLCGHTASTVSSVATLERLIEKAKGMMSEGIRRRVLTIDTTHIEPIDIGQAMAIKSAARRYYGHAAVIFAEHVASWSVDDLHERVQQCTSQFIAGGKTNDPELYGIAWIAGLLLSAAQIGEICDLVPEGGAEQIFPFLQDAVEAWQARRREGSGLAVIEGLVSEARPLGECQEGQVWIGQDRDGEGSARVLYVRTDRLDRGQLRQIKAANKLLELNDNNVAHNYLPRPDGRFIRHYRVRAMTPSVQPAEAA